MVFGAGHGSVGIDFAVAIGVDAGVVASGGIDGGRFGDRAGHAWRAVDFCVARVDAIAAIALSAGIAVAVVIFVGIDDGIAVIVEVEVERFSIFRTIDGADGADAFAPVDVFVIAAFVDDAFLLTIFADAYARGAAGEGITESFIAGGAFASGGGRFTAVCSVSVAVGVTFAADALSVAADHIRGARLVASAAVQFVVGNIDADARADAGRFAVARTRAFAVLAELTF